MKCTYVILVVIVVRCDCIVALNVLIGSTNLEIQRKFLFSCLHGRSFLIDYVNRPHGLQPKQVASLTSHNFSNSG